MVLVNQASENETTFWVPLTRSPGLYSLHTFSFYTLLHDGKVCIVHLIYICYKPWHSAGHIAGAVCIHVDYLLWFHYRLVFAH